ncbi:MAG TPA: ribulose-phosphate 3-epimerase [Planctomycetota bacterium]|nr:ribulose-phosphate 3-epimerase [Planctomycetota bacterium]
MIKIAPSLLSADFGRLREEIDEVTAAGADLLHLDVMDGHFVPNLTFGPFIVEAIRKLTKLPLDCHLMIEDPLTYGPRFAKAGADIVTFHVEVEGDPGKTFDAIEKAGAKAGMVVNPGTDPARLEPWLPRCAMVLVMSVWPGFGGQKFMPEVLEKIPVFKDTLGYAGDVEIDGGIAPGTAAAAKAAGANVLVAGSAIFGSRDRKGVIRALREA